MKQKLAQVGKVVTVYRPYKDKNGETIEVVIRGIVKKVENGVATIEHQHGILYEPIEAS